MKMPKHLYYITHKDNLKSILKYGIFSHRHAEKWGLLGRLIAKKTVIYDKDIINIRRDKKFKDRSLWDYANVYFQARNPMLYQVIKKFRSEEIVLLQINPDIIKLPGAVVTDGNAASESTDFFENESIKKSLNNLDDTLFNRDYWTDIYDGKRKIMAEVLIPNKIPSKNIIGIYTDSQKTSKSITEQLEKILNNIPVTPEPWMFFRPRYIKVICPIENVPFHNREHQDTLQNLKNQAHITLKQGDMFFSKMQTFTISVNTVGVMGKGLASRAKYQFPGLYVVYQDLCRQRKLKMGSPFLYKSSESIDKILMEDFFSFTGKKRESSCFLLFPTKNHWKYNSPIEGIEKGLKWLAENYKDQGIESLALPALGCGLGGLAWKEVGPLMCKYLKQMDIKSEIYLPLETEILKEQLQPDFLFNNL